MGVSCLTILGIGSATRLTALSVQRASNYPMDTIHAWCGIWETRGGIDPQSQQRIDDLSTCVPSNKDGMRLTCECVCDQSCDWTPMIMLKYFYSMRTPD